MNLNAEVLRQDFPALTRQVHGHPLVYLDNAATTLKPNVVVETLKNHFLMGAANIHRAVHTLGEEATHQYESTRLRIAQFIGAQTEREIIFTKGTTDGINLLASSLGQGFLKADDEVIISHMEHHSNIVPWQMLRERIRIKLKVIPIDERGDIIWDEYKKLLGPKTKLVSVVYISNSLGTINPIKEMIKLAHEAGALFLVDAAQAMAHLKVNVRELDCDFLVFSGHKIYGPTGVGVLYGKEKWLKELPPYQGGGDMIASVTFEKTLYNVLPYKFEAGTPAIGEVIALKAALDYLDKIGLENIGAYEQELLHYATHELKKIAGLKIVGEAQEKSAVISFVVEDVHPHDLGTFLDQEGVAIRTGHHCTQPVMDRYQVPATARASFAFYNTKADVDQLVAAIKKCLEFFR